MFRNENICKLTFKNQELLIQKQIDNNLFLNKNEDLECLSRLYVWNEIGLV